jgi:hypothetical protein
MKGISLQISNEEGIEKGISPELLKALTEDGWTIDNIETF